VRKIFPILVFIGLIASASSCKKSSSGKDVPQMLEQGSWFVHYFNNGSDQTVAYAAYSFVFSSSGSVTASIGGIQETGTWQFMENGNTLTLQWTTSGILKDLNNTWTVTGTIGDLITTTNSGGKELHFKKS
jgi:hypothetical protein